MAYVSSKVFVFLCAVVLAVTMGAALGAIYSLAIHSTGTVNALPYFTISGDADKNGNLDWGCFCAGDVVNRTVTLTNIGAASSSALNMTSTLNSSIGVLSWDAEDKVVAAGKSLDVVFVLESSVSAPNGNFNFDIIII